MKRASIVLLCAAATLTSCKRHRGMEGTPAATKAPQQFTATLQGAQEVPPVTTSASGEITLTLNTDHTQLHYTLTVQNIENVTMAHLHLGAAGTNGDHVAWLYPSAPPPKVMQGKFSGKLAEGTLTVANLVGPLRGKPFSDLVQDLQAGKLYVNVHTSAHPSGELRGQLHSTTQVATAK